MTEIPMLSMGMQLFTIGFVIFCFTMIKANKMFSDDPSNLDMKQYIAIRFDLFTSMFFMVGSMFF